MRKSHFFSDLDDDEIPSRVNEFESCTETTRELSSSRRKRAKESSSRKSSKKKIANNQIRSTKEQSRYNTRSVKMDRFHPIESSNDQTIQNSKLGRVQQKLP